MVDEETGLSPSLPLSLPLSLSLPSSALIPKKVGGALFRQVLRTQHVHTKRSRGTVLAVEPSGVPAAVLLTPLGG